MATLYRHNLEDPVKDIRPYDSCSACRMYSANDIFHSRVFKASLKHEHACKLPHEVHGQWSGDYQTTDTVKEMEAP